MTNRASIWEDGRWAPIAILVTIVIVGTLLGYFFWYVPNAPAPRGYAGTSPELQAGTMSGSSEYPLPKSASSPSKGATIPAEALRPVASTGR